MEPVTCHCGLIAVGKCTTCGKWVCSLHNVHQRPILCDECYAAREQNGFTEWEQRYLPHLPAHPLLRLMVLNGWGQLENRFGEPHFKSLIKVSTLSQWATLANSVGIPAARVNIDKNDYQTSLVVSSNLLGKQEAVGWLFPDCWNGTRPHIFILTNGTVTLLSHKNTRHVLLQKMNDNYSLLIDCHYSRLLGIMANSYEQHRMTTA